MHGGTLTMFGRFRSKTLPPPQAAMDRIASEAHAPSRGATEARIAEIRAERHHRALLNIMEAVIHDGIESRADKGTDDA